LHTQLISAASLYGGYFIKDKNFVLREVGTEESCIINTKLCLKRLPVAKFRVLFAELLKN